MKIQTKARIAVTFLNFYLKTGRKILKFFRFKSKKDE